MALIVQRYGGASLADVDGLRAVAERVIARAARDRVVVVVSAMGTTTNGLLTLADHVSMPLDARLEKKPPDSRDLDILVATGELVSSALLTMELKRRGCRARAFTGAQAGLHTDENYMNARILKMDSAAVQGALDAGEVPVVAGSQGMVSPDEISSEPFVSLHEITTLGRDGADLTAVALAAILRADVCEIYTDVEGVFTADPSVVPDARKLDWVTHEEMLEMASLGASVLQSKAVEYAKQESVTIHVRSSFTGDSGTFVTKEGWGVDRVVTSVTLGRNQCKISLHGVPDEPGIAAKVFLAIAALKIVVDMIVQNISHAGLTDISFTVPRAEGKRAYDALQSVKEEVGAREVLLDNRIAKVSIVGTGMRNQWGTAAKMFDVLGDNRINIQMISTSEIAISCVIEEKYAELGERLLHDAFELGDRAQTTGERHGETE